MLFVRLCNSLVRIQIGPHGTRGYDSLRKPRAKLCSQLFYNNSNNIIDVILNAAVVHSVPILYWQLEVLGYQSDRMGLSALGVSHARLAKAQMACDRLDLAAVNYER